MVRMFVAVTGAVVLQLALSGIAIADPAAEKYVDDAMPIMYHSCESVVEEASGDSAYVDKVIRSLVAVSLYNRDVDVPLFTVSDNEKNAMHETFIVALKSGCEADKQALLAGVIDEAVAKALSGARTK